MDRRTLMRRTAAAVLAGTLSASPLFAQDEVDISQKAVADDPVAPRSGAAPGVSDVTVVTFFDYNCPYCRRMEPALAALTAADPKVRIVYRDWPILSPASREAARLAIASQWQDRHGAFHAALMATRGPVGGASLRAAADRAGVDWARLQRDVKTRGATIDALLMRTEAIARTIGFGGTPVLIVGSQIVPGAVDLAMLRRLVAAARAEKKRPRR